MANTTKKVTDAYHFTTSPFWLVNSIHLRDKSQDLIEKKCYQKFYDLINDAIKTNPPGNEHPLNFLVLYFRHPDHCLFSHTDISFIRWVLERSGPQYTSSVLRYGTLEMLTLYLDINPQVIQNSPFLYEEALNITGYGNKSLFQLLLTDEKLISRLLHDPQIQSNRALNQQAIIGVFDSCFLRKDEDAVLLLIKHLSQHQLERIMMIMGRSRFQFQLQFTLPLDLMDNCNLVLDAKRFNMIKALNLFQKINPTCVEESEQMIKNKKRPLSSGQDNRRKMYKLT